MEPLEVAAKVAGAAAALVGSYRVLLHRYVQRTRAKRHVRDVNIAQIPIVVGQLETLTATIEQIKRELHTNGGRSLRDEIQSINSKGMMNEQRMRALLQSWGAEPTFEADASGEWTWVNRVMTKLADRSSEELVGNGWKNLVAPDERAGVAAEWIHSVRDKRECSIRFKLQMRKSLVWVTLNSFPVRTGLGGANGVLGYFGIIEQDAAVAEH